MNVIQILGPSYAGSTALGYALNTVDGFVFGSELRRLLPAVRSRAKQRPSCDLCGETCEYWSNEFYEALDAIDNCGLDDVYQVFSRMHPEVSALVDGSKSLAATKDTDPDVRILTVKHPMRLLASSIYNDRKKLRIETDRFEDIREILQEKPGWSIQMCEAKLVEALAIYLEFFEHFEQLFQFKNDMAHLDDSSGFHELEEALQLAPGAIRAAQFSTTPCHSVGGNRAPFWLSLKARLGEAPTNPRAEYYDQTASFGDWRIDDKFKILLPTSLVDEVKTLAAYKDLCELLNYHSDTDCFST